MTFRYTGSSVEGYAVKWVKLSCNRISNAVAGPVLNCQPRVEHARQFNDYEEHYEQNWQDESELNEALSSLFATIRP